MLLTKLDIAILLVTAMLPAVVAAVMLGRHQQKRWPLFFLYCCFSLLAGVVLIVTALFFKYRTYFQVYFFCQSGYVALALLAMNEAFKSVFAVYYSSRWWFRLLLPSIGLLIVGISLWHGFHRLRPHSGALWTAFLTFNLGGDYIRAAVFGLFGILVFFWQPPWQRHPFAVMKGFGFYSIVGMLSDLLRSDFGTKMDTFFSYAPPVAYIVACFIWLGGFLAPEPEKSARGSGGLVNVAELRELVERLTRAIR